MIIFIVMLFSRAKGTECKCGCPLSAHDNMREMCINCTSCESYTRKGKNRWKAIN